MKPTYFDAKGNPIETITSAILDYEQIAEEARYDGFNALATGLGDDPCQIIRVNSYRWEIEDCFRVEKSDLNMRPVYVRSPKRIAAHFFICFLSLLIRSDTIKMAYERIVVNHLHMPSYFFKTFTEYP